MTRSARFFLGALTLLLGLCAPARGEAQPVPQDLYLDAMRSIADGRQSDASNALIRLTEQEPDHAGAWLDLAIIQCQLGHADEAERLFLAIESRFSPPQGILEVINRHRAQGCASWKPNSHASIMLGRGVNSNVNQGASNPFFSIGSGDYRVDLQLLPEYLPRHDQYTMLSADYMRDLNPNGDVGFMRFHAYLNDVLTHFNTSSLVVGLERPWRFADWGVRGTGTLALLGLGGQLYQKQTQIQAQISPPLTLPDKFQFSMLASLAHVEYPTLTNFDAYTWDARGMLVYRSERNLAQVTLGYSADRETGGRPGGDRQGWTASLQGRTRIAGEVFGELGWNRQMWRSQSVYSPGLIDQVRHQDTQVLSASIIVPVNARQEIHFDWREVQNVENISLFQYNGRLFQVSWRWQGS